MIPISLGQDPGALRGPMLYEAMVLAEEGVHKDLKDVILAD